MNKYVDEFLHYKCAGDVLNSISRLGKPEKEITESMAVIKQLKKIVLPEPMKYDLIDACARNALTSVLAVHLLPIKEAFAIDRKKRKGGYDKVKRFTYNEVEIDENACPPGRKDILISVHPCQTADLLIDLFNQSCAKALILMPCCHGMSDDVPCKSWMLTKMSKYDLWTYHLALKIKNRKVTIFKDPNVISPKNNIIIAV